MRKFQLLIKGHTPLCAIIPCGIVRSVKFISKDRINIDINGKLTYDSKPVYRLQSCNGYTLIPEINDFIDSEVIEQRHQEQIELEDFVFSQNNQIGSFTYARQRRLEILSVGYIQITLQKRQIELQKKQVDRQITDLDNNIKLSIHLPFNPAGVRRNYHIIF